MGRPLRLTAASIALALLVSLAPSHARADAAAASADAASADASVSVGAADAASDAAAPTKAERRRIRAAIVGTAPFVVHDGGELAGISVDVWRAVAASAGFTTELVPIATVPLAVEAAARHDVDVAVGPISITAERAERVRFTQPYFQSSLGILAPRTSGSLLARVTPFVSRAFAVGVAVLFAVLALVGALVWLAERKKNPSHFPPQPLAGIGNGIWFALVTMTTVGYGDRAPITPAGRAIAGVWMVVALLTASSLTAGIATALTLARLTPGRIATREQLADRRVAVVRGTPGVSFAVRSHARTVIADDLSGAVAKVVAEEADAIVFDRPMLLHYLRKNPELDFVVAEARYTPQGYGFALPLDSDLQHDLNVALLRASENGVVTRATADWIGASDDEADEP